MLTHRVPDEYFVYDVEFWIVLQVPQVKERQFGVYLSETHVAISLHNWKIVSTCCRPYAKVTVYETLLVTPTAVSPTTWLLHFSVVFLSRSLYIRPPIPSLYTCPLLLRVTVYKILVTENVHCLSSLCQGHFIYNLSCTVFTLVLSLSRSLYIRL